LAGENFPTVTPTNIHLFKMDNSMFTRSELEIKTLGELKGLCKQYGLKPLGNPAYKTAWIDALLTFAAIALRQMKEGEGLTRMTFKGYQDLGQALDQMGQPTDQQAALIKATMQGKRLEYPHRYDQEALLNLHKAKMHLEQALDLLNM
jgi:hypothetical protein